MRVIIILAIIVLGMALVFVGYTVGKYFSADVTRQRQLEAENASLRQGESAEVKELRKEVQDYSDMTDDVVGQLTRQVNGLNVTTTTQDILLYITTKRPRRSI